MRAVIAITALSLSTTAVAQLGPSFDCRSATTEVEQAICADRTLSALDARLAGAYAAKLRQLSPGAAATFREHQRWFLAIRDARFEAEPGGDTGPSTASIKASMEQRLREIARISTRPPADFSGTWSSPMGDWSIVRIGNDRYSIAASTVEQVNARWVCDTQGSAQRQRDGTLLLDDAYRLSRNGSVLSVARVGRSGADGGDDNCGMNGSLEGDYLLTTEEPRTALDATN